MDQTFTEITESLEEEDLEERILEDPIDPLIQPRTHYPYYNNEEKTKKKHGWGVGKAAAWLMIGIVQLITLMILIPFGLGEFVFCFGFGLLVFLLFQGAKLWGLTLVCLGLIGIFQAIRFGVVADRKTGDEETAVPDRLDRQRDHHRHRCSADDDRIFQL